MVAHFTSRHGAACQKTWILRSPNINYISFRTDICYCNGNNVVQNIHPRLRQLYQEMSMVSAVRMETIWKERKIICKLVCFVGCSGSHRKEFPARGWWDGRAEHASFHDVYRSPFTDGSLLNWTPSDACPCPIQAPQGLERKFRFHPPPSRFTLIHSQWCCFSIGTTTK